MQGPNDGSRKQIMTFFPNLVNACPNPTVVVVLPSPAGVGEIAVTKISFPAFLSKTFCIKGKEIFPLYRPYLSIFPSSIPTIFPISSIGFISTCLAISISLNILFSYSIFTTSMYKLYHKYDYFS